MTRPPPLAPASDCDVLSTRIAVLVFNAIIFLATR
jgi:hypothetical protein